MHAQLHVMNCSEDLLEIGHGANTTAQIWYKNKEFDSTAHPAAVAPYLKLPPPYKAGPDERGCVKCSTRGWIEKGVLPIPAAAPV